MAGWPILERVKVGLCLLTWSMVGWSILEWVMVWLGQYWCGFYFLLGPLCLLILQWSGTGLWSYPCRSAWMPFPPVRASSVDRDDAASACRKKSGRNEEPTFHHGLSWLEAWKLVELVKPNPLTGKWQLSYIVDSTTPSLVLKICTPALLSSDEELSRDTSYNQELS